MKLLAMLFASLLHWRTRPPLAWPARWQPAVAPGVAPLLALSLGPALAAALLLWLCGGWLWGLLGLAVQTSVLCGCLGGTDRRALFDSLIADGERGDLQAALHTLDELGPVAEVAGGPGLCRAATEALALRGVREWFAVLFWFALLGAPGALLYRCLERIAAGSGRGRGALAVLEWPALRAFGLVTALTGRPGRVLGAWADTLFASPAPAPLAGAYAAAALDEPPAELPAGAALAARVRALETLLGRVVLAWLALMAAAWILL